MAQDRMIRGEMRESEKVNEWPIPVRYFWTQLWGYCDDHGRGKYEPRLIKAGTFPVDDEVSAAQVGRWMKALETAEVIRPYEVAVHRLPTMWVEMGKKKAAEARRIYKECVDTGQWPGYDTEIQFLDPPTWLVFEHEARYENQEIRI